jgi:hypothetical protein
LPSPRAASIKKFDIDIALTLCNITPSDSNPKPGSLSVNIKGLRNGQHTIDALLKGDMDISWIAEFPKDETHWMIKNNLTTEKGIPDFVNYICVDGLKAVKPEAVSIIR